MTQAAPRICFVSAHFPPDVGGIQNYTLEVATRLARQHPGFFLATMPAKQRRSASAENVAFPVHRVGLRLDELALSGVPGLLRLCRKHRPDAALAAHWAPAAALATVRRLTGYPRRIVTVSHGKDAVQMPFAARSPAGRFYAHTRRRGLGQSDALIAVSRFVAHNLTRAGYPESRITVVNNGVSAARFSASDGATAKQALGLEGKTVLLSAARLIPRKGLDLSLRAFALARAAEPNRALHHVIVGSGKEEAALRALAQELGLSTHVTFAGEVGYAAMPAYYHACDIFMLLPRDLPGDVEGFGLVFLEAGACGKPVIGARAGGVVDAIDDARTGLLIAPDSPQAAASALLALPRDPERAHALGDEGRRQALGPRSWDAACTQIADILCAALPGKACVGELPVQDGG